jgi:hypothetical protein
MAKSAEIIRSKKAKKEYYVQVDRLLQTINLIKSGVLIGFEETKYKQKKCEAAILSEILTLDKREENT